MVMIFPPGGYQYGVNVVEIPEEEFDKKGLKKVLLENGYPDDLLIFAEYSLVYYGNKLLQVPIKS